MHFFARRRAARAKNGYELVKFFFLLTFAAAIPAIVSGGIAERARFSPQLAATVAARRPRLSVLRRHRLERRTSASRPGSRRRSAPSSTTSPAASSCTRSAAGSALAAVLLLGARSGRYRKDGAIAAHPPSNIPFLALGAWMLSVGWFGFNVMSAQTLDKISRPGRGQFADGDGGRHAGRARRRAATTRASCTTARSPAWSRSAPAPTSCIRSARSPPARVAGAIFVVHVHADAEPLEDRRRARRVAAARPVRRVGRHRRGHLRREARWAAWAASRSARRSSAPLLGIAIAVARRLRRLRRAEGDGRAAPDAEEEFDGADLTIHKISATPDQEVRW